MNSAWIALDITNKEDRRLPLWPAGILGLCQTATGDIAPLFPFGYVLD